jgi:hypothetical protein
MALLVGLLVDELASVGRFVDQRCRQRGKQERLQEDQVSKIWISGPSPTSRSR